MRLKYQTLFATASVLILAAATAARADVTISTDATANMSCSGGVCAPTASDAVLNVGDLQTLLASGNVTVTTTGSGVQATNIDVTANLGWSANALTLDAYQSLSVTAPVTASGKSGLSILTNDGGSGGELAFFGKGHVTFKKLSGKLSINGARYTLVNSIASLAAAIQKKPSGDYALAADYDASRDGTYGGAPVATTLNGALEGLGNKISNLSIDVRHAVTGEETGLFAAAAGVVGDIGVVEARVRIISFKVHRKNYPVYVGILTGTNSGIVTRCYSTGTVSASIYTVSGGLVGINRGTIAESYSKAVERVDIDGPNHGSGAGGLVGSNSSGLIELSYASGAVQAGETAGGLVGGSSASIVNSYATGEVSAEDFSGGLVGLNDYDPKGTIAASYSTGNVSGSMIGGLIGLDQSPSGSLSDTYWDTDTSGITNPDQGAGSPLNDPGITGLTTEQLQSGLPAGFDPSIWGENANINNGLPYLLANPPN
jgi:hypothetical protein